MLHHLLELIHAYQAAVEEAISLFERHKGLRRPRRPEEWITSGIPQSGHIDEAGTIPYFLHGFGCAVKLPSGGVDWDFGLQGQTDGLDPWRLWQFARGRPTQFPELQEREAFDAAFQEAEASGLIRKSEYILYYLEEPRSRMTLSRRVVIRNLSPSRP